MEIKANLTFPFFGLKKKHFGLGHCIFFFISLIFVFNLKCIQKGLFSHIMAQLKGAIKLMDYVFSPSSTNPNNPAE